MPSRRILWIVAPTVLIALAGVAIAIYEATEPDDLDEMRRTYDQAARMDVEALRARVAPLAREAEARRAALAAATSPAALDRIEPDPNLPCGVKLDPPAEPISDATGLRSAVFDSATDYTLSAPGKPVGSTHFDAVAAAIEGVERHVTKGEADASDIAVLDQQTLPDHAIYVVGTQTEAVLLEHSYDAGEVRGRVYLYSFPDARIVCAGDVDVRNRPSVMVHSRSPAGDRASEQRSAKSSAEYTLHVDLEFQLRLAIATGLSGVRRP